ncbi:MAG TPA: hypothetical protein DFI01_06620 [Bacteroidales bacterium]|nr:hypothetical protein [Bacteroidales bacterium]
MALEVKALRAVFYCISGISALLCTFRNNASAGIFVTTLLRMRSFSGREPKVKRMEILIV